MAKKHQIKPSVRQMAESFSFIDSSTHRLHPSRGRTFHLKQGNDNVPVFVKVEEDRSHGISHSTLARKHGRLELTIPVRKGKTSMFSSPVEIELNGKKYRLAAMASPSKILAGLQRVSLSLYSDDEQ